MARRARARQGLDSIGENAAEALLLEKARERVGVDELGVAEDRRLAAERLGDGRPVQLDLLGELLPRGEPRERVVRGLGQELDAAVRARRRGEAPERVEGVRRPRRELLEQAPRDRERDGEARVALEQPGEHRRRGPVGAFADVPEERRG